MTPSDPYQKSFATVEELLSNPRGRVRQNPSKAKETIVAAVKASGGWINNTSWRGTDYVITAGPMAGTYTLGQVVNRYTPEFAIVDSDDFANDILLTLVASRYEKLWKILQPVYNAVVVSGMFPELPPMLNVRTIDETRHDLLYWADVHDALSDEREDLLDDKARAVRQALKDFNANPEGYAERVNHANKVMRFMRTDGFGHAVQLYILSQAGSVPVSTVLKQVEEQPKRLLSLYQVRIPTRLSDRTRYAAEFFRTWSAGKAANRILPNVEGGMPYDWGMRLVPQDVRDLLNYVPSWRQLTEKEIPSTAGTHGMTVKAAKQLAAVNWVSDMIFQMRMFQQEGISPTVFRKQLLPKYDLPQLSLLKDALEGVRKGASVLVQTPEGRLLVRAREERDWPRLLRGHDQAVAAADQMGGAKSQKVLDDAEKFKRGAARFTMIPGVRPLITKAEYKCEGDEMKHCVHSMGYYLKRDGYEFAFAAPDGTRATLELDAKTGRVRQFFGPQDMTPSKTTQKMLDKFLAVNDDNIALLQEGKFSKKSRDNPQRGWT